MMKRTLTILTLFLIANWTTAQVYPVQTSLQVTPPYSVNLPDYVAVGSERMALNVLLTDISRAQLDAQLKLTIEGNGIQIETNPAFNPSPITLVSGFNNRLIAADLEPYFRPQNLIFRGMSAQQYINSGGALPEGVYRFCFEVLEYNRNVKISNTTCVTAWLILNDPPIINLPTMDDKLTPMDPQFVRFQWTPRHTGSPNSAFSTEYDFELVEIWPKGRNPNDAMLTTPPIYTTTTFATSLVYGLAEPALVRGRQYAFRVRARSVVGIEQLDLFRNDGYSQVHLFTYGDECIPPSNFSIESTSTRRINLTWTDDGLHNAYTVSYRKKGETDWATNNVLFNDYSIEGLQPNTQYEVRILGQCGFVNSETTETKLVSTESEPDSDFQCGTPPEAFNLGNKNPLQSLGTGDIIYAGDFDVKVADVSGSGGTFTGTGQVVLPMMNHVKMGTSFTGIKVNDEYRMYEGQMHFTALTGQILDDETLDNIQDTFDDIYALEDDINDILDLGEEVMDSINAIIEEIQNTEVFTQEEYNALIDPSADISTLEGEALQAAENAVEEVLSGGSIIEAATEVAKAQTILDRIKDKKNQAAHIDTVAHQAVRFLEGDQGPGHLAIEPKYYKINTDDGDKHGPWFSIKTGSTSTIIAEWIQDSQIPKDEITFILGQQTIEFTETADGWELTVPAASHQEERVLKAIHDGKTVGIAGIISFNSINRNVVLVSVNGADTPSDSDAADYLTDIYGQAMVNWTVSSTSIDISDDWDLNGNDNLYLGENNDLSTYTDEAKALIRLSKDKLSVNNNAYYLLFINTENSLGAGGYMPRKKQFGFIFENSLHTIAHELGHGAFRLAHTWEEFPNLSSGETQNIMDYSSGKLLRKYQWEQIHDPKWVVSLFDDEEEGAIRGNYWFDPNWTAFRIPKSKTTIFHRASLAPDGTVRGFETEDGNQYLAQFDENGGFTGYGYPESEIEFLDTEDQGDEIINLYLIRGDCSYEVTTTVEEVKANLNLNQGILQIEFANAKLEGISPLKCYNDSPLKANLKKFVEQHQELTSDVIGEIDAIGELYEDLIHKNLNEDFFQSQERLSAIDRIWNHAFWKDRPNVEQISVFKDRLTQYWGTYSDRIKSLESTADQENAIELVHALSLSQIESSSLDLRFRTLELIASDKIRNQWNFLPGAGGENAVLKILESVKDEEAGTFINDLRNSEFFWSLEADMADLGNGWWGFLQIGNDHYDDFSMEIVRLVSKAYPNQENAENFINVPIDRIWRVHLDEITKEKIEYSAPYKILFKENILWLAKPYHILGNADPGYDESPISDILHPLTPVYIKHFDSDEGRIVPAWYFAYLANQEMYQNAMATANLMLDVLSLPVAVTALSKARTVWAFSSALLEVGASGGNMILISDDVSMDKYPELFKVVQVLNIASAAVNVTDLLKDSNLFKGVNQSKLKAEIDQYAQSKGNLDSDGLVGELEQLGLRVSGNPLNWPDNVIAKLDELEVAEAGIKSRFFEEFANTSVFVVEEFAKNVKLVEAWKSLDELGSSLKTDPAALTKLLDDFSVNPSLEAFLKNKPSKKDVWEMLHKTPYSSDINALEYIDEIRNTTKVGSANTTDYLNTWRDKFPNLQGGEPGKYFNVHHAIERQVIESRWPGLFTEAEIHSLENLRGISGELNSSLHLSEIRNRWDDFYDLYPPGGAVPTRQQVLDYAKQIDDEFGKFFSPPIRPLDY